MNPSVADVKSGQIEAQAPAVAAAQPPEAAAIQKPIATNPATPHRHHHHRPSVLTAMQSLVYLIVIAIFIITFCAQPFRIPSESMESTLLVGDFLLVDKQVSQPTADVSAGVLPSTAVHRGDIIVFHDPVDSASISSSASSSPRRPSPPPRRPRLHQRPPAHRALRRLPSQPTG